MMLIYDDNMAKSGTHKCDKLSRIFCFFIRIVVICYAYPQEANDTVMMMILF